MFNFSPFFGGSSSDSFGLSSINFTDYKMIKSGSYKKLMKAYYADQSSSSSSASKSSSSKTKSGKSVAEQIIADKMKGSVVKDPTGLTQMQSQASTLKSKAEAYAEGDVFKDEYGYYDTDKAFKSVKDFVNQYNSVLDQAGKVTSADVTGEVGYMKSMTNALKSDLEKIGITIGDDGKLSVNEEAFKKVGESEVKAVFGGNGTFADAIADKAQSIAGAAFRNASFYASDGSFYSSSASTYSNQA